MRGAILAGGSASRYDGKPKGLEKVGGERIIDRVLQPLKIATGETPILSANAEDAKTWIPDVTVVADTHKECGSLGGLHAVIKHDKSPVLVVAWDMPFVPVELLEKLISLYDGKTVAVLPESEMRGGVEPMCAVYGPECLQPIEDQIEDEDYRASGFLEHVEHTIISLDDLAAIGDVDSMFFNVNAPEDLKKAEEMWRARHE